MVILRADCINGVGHVDGDDMPVPSPGLDDGVMKRMTACTALTALGRFFDGVASTGTSPNFTLRCGVLRTTLGVNAMGVGRLELTPAAGECIAGNNSSANDDPLQY